MEIVNPGDIKVEVNDDFDDGDNNNTRLTSAEQPLALVKKKNIEIDNITERFPYIDEVNKFSKHYFGFNFILTVGDNYNNNFNKM